MDFKQKLDSGKVRGCVVIGASWVGIKVVEDLRARNIACTLVDGAPWMFYTAAFEETARRVRADLEQKGVAVSCGQMLSAIEREEDGRLTAVMESKSRFTADLIAVCGRAGQYWVCTGQRPCNGTGNCGGFPDADQL